MSPADPTPLAATPAPADARALIEQQIAALSRLTEIGMALAEEAGRRGLDASEPAGGPDPCLMFSRAARAVRLTIALQSRLLAELAALDRDERLAEIGRETARGNRVRRLVERALDAGCDDADEAERLQAHAWERLVDELDDPDFADRPIAEIVALICADLGLSPAETARAVAEVAGGADPPQSYHPEAFDPAFAPTSRSAAGLPARQEVPAEPG
jgi:hypothetical protein